MFQVYYLKKKNSDRANKFFRKIIGESFKLDDYLRVKKVNNNDEFIDELIFEALKNSEFFSARWRDTLIKSVENKFDIFQRDFNNILNNNKECISFWKNIILIFLVFKEFILANTNKFNFSINQKLTKYLYSNIIDNINKTINILKDSSISEGYLKIFKYFKISDNFYNEVSYIKKLSDFYLKVINNNIYNFNLPHLLNYNGTKLLLKEIDSKIIKKFLNDNKYYFIDNIFVNYLNFKSETYNLIPWIQICFFESKPKIKLPNELFEKDIKIDNSVNMEIILKYIKPIQKWPGYASNNFSHLELNTEEIIRNEDLKNIFNFFGCISIDFSFSEFLINQKQMSNTLIKDINSIFPNIFSSIFSIYQSLNIFKKVKSELEEMSNWLNIIKWFYKFL